jgi:hypothetical protein
VANVAQLSSLNSKSWRRTSRPRPQAHHNRAPFASEAGGPRAHDDPLGIQPREGAVLLPPARAGGLRSLFKILKPPQGGDRFEPRSMRKPQLVWSVI